MSVQPEPTREQHPVERELRSSITRAVEQSAKALRMSASPAERAAVIPVLEVCGAIGCALVSAILASGSDVARSVNTEKSKLWPM